MCCLVRKTVEASTQTDAPIPIPVSHARAPRVSRLSLLESNLYPSNLFESRQYNYAREKTLADEIDKLNKSRFLNQSSQSNHSSANIIHLNHSNQSIHSNRSIHSNQSNSDRLEYLNHGNPYGCKTSLELQMGKKTLAMLRRNTANI